MISHVVISSKTKVLIFIAALYACVVSDSDTLKITPDKTVTDTTQRKIDTAIIDMNKTLEDAKKAVKDLKKECKKRS